MSSSLILMIAVSLSMDAFSLSLAYGTLSLSKKERLELAVIVGCFHFFMPLIGLCVGETVIKMLPLSPAWVVFIVLSFIGVEMIMDSFKKKENVSYMNKMELFLFGFAVSVDSFSVGVGLKALTSHIFSSSFMFCLSSFFFTYLGLYLGNLISNKIGKLATFLGGTILIVIAFFYLGH